MVDHLCIYLFGRFRVDCGKHSLLGLKTQKPQELLCYLLIHRNRQHHREKLANVLWEKSSKSRSKQYLRQNLWQLQSSLEAETCNGNRLITVDADWIQINPDADYTCDVKQFEQAYKFTQGVHGCDLDHTKAEVLRDAVQLYRGDLLEDLYQDWIILERERLQNIYLTMLEKLMSCCEARQDYEQGIEYGSRILRCDLARERTYRRLMRLRYLKGDRTGALREFETCVAALDEELGVKPSQRTLVIYEQIRDDNPLLQFIDSSATRTPLEPFASQGELISRLNNLKTILIKAQRQIEENIEFVRSSRNGRQ